MKKIVIIAPTGMLGSMVYNILKEKYDLVLIYKNKTKLSLLEKVYGGLKKHRTVQFDIVDLYKDYLNGFPRDSVSPTMQKLIGEIGEVDYIINCAGIIKQRVIYNPGLMVFINGVFPHKLSNIYKEKLLHITTDCVYSGISGAPYNEKAPKSPNDFYGLSKSMGEPSDSSLVIRTSIIGPELSGHLSLLNWFLSQKKEVKGFINHYWNGITTKQFAYICNKIIDNRESYPRSGLYHIFSTDVTKYEILTILKKKYNSNMSIIPAETPKVDRRLSSIFPFCKNLSIPSFQNMVDDL